MQKADIDNAIERAIIQTDKAIHDLGVEVKAAASMGGSLSSKPDGRMDGRLFYRRTMVDL
ncbi:hypothetical protein [Anaerocolumna sp.]|uniref:hypothetical protein n=1 Tax=Anaerocolumna sp. TaxID=2041569 RepID=UPI0028B18BCE|nr:hypothetical protein [Anaerocolumna sp.]